MFLYYEITRKIRSALALRWVIVACMSLFSSTYAAAWWNAEWLYRKPIAVNATTINNTGEVDSVPVLIRLHEGVFSFKDAQAGGTDLRFVAADDKTPLKFHIEKYDAVANIAFVWVNLPKIKLKDKTNIWMYYGNSKAKKADTPSASYDANQSLIYHFSEVGTPVSDTTGYGNHSTSTIQTDSGIIGNSAQFNGTNAVVLPASASLTVTPESKMTWSAWIKPAASAENAIIFSRREANQAFVIGLNQGAPYVSVSNDSAANQVTSVLSPIEAEWHLIAVIADGTKISLLVDGQVVSSLETTLPTLSGIALLGADAASGANIEQASSNPVAGFVGSVDELSISKQARSADFAQLQVLNQSAKSSLIEYGADEETSSWQTGFMGIIISSLTIDGWIVIAICALMALMSWIIMLRKASLVKRVLKANEEFQKLYATVNGDFAQLEATMANESQTTFNVKGQQTEITNASRTLIKQSPLYHLFHLGEQELAKRLEADENQASTPLATQSIEAIRAKLESQLARENLGLNKNLVMLTIAISGGPFLGLLGTVMGVMITFAAIASSGDVNINAIAPGVAGALAATVAGLVVAIPALFGYNYLITRIKDAVSQMHSFLNVIVTRMAENYANPSKLLSNKKEN